MTTSLPEGIVTHTDSIARDIDQADIITVEDVRRLWRVYNTNKNVLRRNSGRRLENLFWRIWADQGRLCRVLSGSTVAKLFVYISEDADIIRTTPVPSPRTRHRHLHVSDEAAQRRGQGERDELQPGLEATVTPSGTNRAASPRQPISKQPTAAERRSTVDQPGLGPSRQPEGNGGEAASGLSPTSATPTKSSTPPTSTRSSTAQRRKKTTFVANTSTRGRSSVLFRRKSSQSSTSTASSSVRSPQSAVAGDDTRPSEGPPSRQPAVASGEDDDDDARVPEQTASPSGDGGLTPRATPAAQPQRRSGGSGGSSGATRRVGLFPTLSSPALHTRSDAGEMQPRRLDRLAAISTRPAVSKTSATLAATSTAAMGTVGGLPPVPSAASSSVSGRGGTARQGTVIIDEVVPLKPEGATSSAAAAVGLARSKSALNPATSSSAIEDDDDDEDDEQDDEEDDPETAASARATAEPSRAGPSSGLNLPRTKSQLTLLLERDRQQIEVINSRKKKGRKSSA